MNAGALQDYKSGIVKGSDCTETQPDHAVLLVGYSTTGNSWHIKNSWCGGDGVGGGLMFAGVLCGWPGAARDAPAGCNRCPHADLYYVALAWQGRGLGGGGLLPSGDGGGEHRKLPRSELGGACRARGTQRAKAASAGVPVEVLCRPAGSTTARRHPCSANWSVATTLPVSPARSHVACTTQPFGPPAQSTGSMMMIALATPARHRGFSAARHAGFSTEKLLGDWRE